VHGLLGLRWKRGGALMRETRMMDLRAALLFPHWHFGGLSGNSGGASGHKRMEEM
jgi:hypothetical protein